MENWESNLFRFDNCGVNATESSDKNRVDNFYEYENEGGKIIYYCFVVTESA